MLGIAILSFLLSSKEFRTYWKKKHYFVKLQNDLNQLKEENKNLEIEMARLQTDPRMMERYARQELGLVRSGEIEYRFVQEQPDLPSLDSPSLDSVSPDSTSKE